MTTTPTLREAAQQALEAIEPVMAYGRYGTRDVEQAALQKAHTALRAALAEQAVEQAEPVALTREHDARRAAQVENVELKERLARARIDLMRELREQGWTPAPARQEWQPIETAPKTGAKIIVRYVNRNNKPRTVMARWLTDEQAEETDADGVGLKGGWYECIDNWDDYTEVAIHEGEPSLWQPLPAAPIPAAPAEGGANG